MDIHLKEIRSALALIESHNWSHRVPVVRANVRLAVNSLLAYDRHLFSRSAEEILAVLCKKRNTKIRKILRNTSVESFAFGIYSALN